MSDDNDSGGEKMVPERDLIALKRSHAKQMEDLTNQLSEAKRATDDKHQELLTVTAARQAVESKLNNAQGLQTEVDSLKAQLKEATTGREEASNTLLGLRRLSVSQLLGVDPKALEGKTDDQLAVMEETAKLVGKGGNGQDRSSGQFAGGGTGGRTFDDLSATEKIKAGLEIGHPS